MFSSGGDILPSQCTPHDLDVNDGDVLDIIVDETLLRDLPKGVFIARLSLSLSHFSIFTEEDDDDSDDDDTMSRAAAGGETDTEAEMESERESESETEPEDSSDIRAPRKRKKCHRK